MCNFRYTLILSCVLCSLIPASSTRQWASSESPEDDLINDIMADLGEHWEDVKTAAVDLLGWIPGGDNNIDLANYMVANFSSPECENCVTYSVFILSVLDQGYTYDEIRPLAMQLCYRYTEGRGWDGNAMCDGVIDNYLVHFLRVFNDTVLDVSGICELVNKCLPENALPAPMSVSAHLQPYGPKPQRRKVALNDTIKVVHVTDIHSDAGYDTGSATECSMLVCCRDEWPGTGYAGTWGAYDCNIPGRTVDEYLQYLSTMSPDIVLHTGDTPASIHWLETLDGQINQSRIMAEKFASYLPGVPVYTTIGNHEVFPTNIYHVPLSDTDVFNREFALAWQPLSGLQQEQLDTMATGGFYSVEIWPGLRIISYNSNFAVVQNFYVILDQENNGYGAMKQFMQDTFSTARQNGEKVIMIGHHSSGKGDLIREYSEFMTNITRQNADLIVLHLLGHSHRDKFQVNTDPVTGQAYDYQMSVACMTSSPLMNPSARMIYLHPDTLEVMDMDTFYLNIQDPINNSTSSPLIEFGYRFTEEYDMVDCTPDSMRDLVDRLETDDTLLAKYRRNYETRTGSEGPCDDACKAEMMCHMRSTSYTQYLNCMSDSASIY